MNEKSKWFHSDNKNQTVAVVLLAHGLNLLPSKMDQLATFLAFKKCDVLRISLKNNPKEWTENFSDFYDSALEHSEILQKPLYFIGYSLGGLLGIHYIVRHPYQQFKKCIFIAPATHTKFFTIIPALLGHLFPNLSLPSFNLESYRARSRTTLLEYKILRKLQMDIRPNLQTNTINISSLLIINNKDELVSSKKLTKFADLNTHWNTLRITNTQSLLPKKSHHLMINSETIGLKEWDIILKRLTKHFEL